MTMQEKLSVYGTGAFCARRIPTLAPAKEAHPGLMDRPLAWGHYAGLDSVVEIDHQLEAGLHIIYELQQNEEGKQQIFYDAQRWNFENVSRAPYFLFILKVSCFFLPLFIWGGLAGVMLGDYLYVPVLGLSLAFINLYLATSSKKWYAYLIMVLGAVVTAAVIAWNQNALWGYWAEQTAFWLGMILFAIALFGADALLWMYARFYTHDGSGFNRREGTLTIARRFRRPFVAPFYEFDPYIQLQVTPHGGHDYVLWLRHRYTDTSACLATKLHSLGLDKPNILAFWDTLQRYMDVDEPLPDLPILEQSRHLDPVTAAYDQAHNRPPRRWRDMDVNTWRRKEARELRESLEAYPWQRKACILRERIDPALNIETYYRQQEANGIEGTPRADDFDNIHRP
ncbi:hypothetical protein [Halopseudomonas sp.]|uniref:hypothetical protein n=1 Tax=Halopseudomonas sp. TaxID=2901191 RepID=UPI003562E3A6